MGPGAFISYFCVKSLFWSCITSPPQAGFIVSFLSVAFGHLDTCSPILPYNSATRFCVKGVSDFLFPRQRTYSAMGCCLVDAACFLYRVLSMLSLCFDFTVCLLHMENPYQPCLYIRLTAISFEQF